VTADLPNVGCREALADWEALAEVIRSLVRTRAKDKPSIPAGPAEPI
jgi:hypothetical protein